MEETTPTPNIPQMCARRRMWGNALHLVRKKNRVLSKSDSASLRHLYIPKADSGELQIEHESVAQLIASACHITVFIGWCALTLPEATYLLYICGHVVHDYHLCVSTFHVQRMLCKMNSIMWRCRTVSGVEDYKL